MTGGLGALSLGHCHPDWVAAVTEAAGTIGLVSNLYATPPQAELAARLASLLPIPDARVFFCNSGAEANEAAIKLIRERGLARGTPAIVALDGSFHGRTVAALAATGQPAKRAPFEPLVDWFRFVPPGDPGALRAAFAAGDVGGVLLEPVMGEGGVHPLDDAYLRLARELCDEHGALFVVDEVQSGFRCGDWLAISHAGVTPDAACLAKALGGGLPIGALVARADIAFGPGEHATTYGGGPVPSSAALAVLDVIERDGLLERSLEIGARLTAAVVTAAPTGAIAEIRGRGCLWGFELAPAADGTPADANAVVLADARGRRAGLDRRPVGRADVPATHDDRCRRGPRRRVARRRARDLGGAGVTRSNGATKAKRQQAILALVSRERLGSQEEIRARLASMGIAATQSTISRDIEELGLARVHEHDGMRYVVPGQGSAPAPVAMLRRLLDEFALSLVRADQGLIVRTPPGAAAALAEGIDRVGLAGVAGTIAGDNTILILGREGVKAAQLERSLNEIMEAS